jgi:hypothetical protein
MPTAASAKAAAHRTIDEIGQRDGVTARNVTVGRGSGVTGVKIVAGTDAGTGNAGAAAFLRSR